MSVADWIRLSRLQDVPSLGGTSAILACHAPSTVSTEPLRGGACRGFRLTWPVPRGPRGSCPFRTGRKSKMPSSALVSVMTFRSGHASGRQAPYGGPVGNRKCHPARSPRYDLLSAARSRARMAGPLRRASRKSKAANGGKSSGFSFWYAVMKPANVDCSRNRVLRRP